MRTVYQRTHIIRFSSMKRSHSDDHCDTQAIRAEFDTFVRNRNWRFCNGYWSRIIQNSAHSLPAYVEGNKLDANGADKYGVTDLEPLYQAGMKGEYTSKNFRYQSKQTIALRIGYDGNQYFGYQMQKYCPGITVEGDLKLALGRNTIGAGRTDKGVSAVSQVICFATQDMDLSPKDYINKFKESEPFLSGRLAVYDCYRVPKKFHSRGSATWRRYLYMFPLNKVARSRNEIENDGILRGTYTLSESSTSSAVATSEYDVDIEYLNKILSK
jgi:hypothetical protein